MKAPVLVPLLFALLSGPLMGQSNNALDCDGLDDAVSVPGASGLLSGASGITLSCWVYPRNTAPGFPDFDGFAGMRNELDCDFYLLQVSPADAIEGRMRNSNGEVFTITANGLQLNSWQHLALTYNGSLLQLYRNGVVIGSTAASGTLNNATVPMLIGDVEYEFTDFFLDGKVDEVALWDRALSDAEVNCVMAQGAELTDADLQLYYKCDQGVAGGNNAGIVLLTDATGNINGDINFFALSGATSNFTQGAPMGSLITAQICQGEGYVFNGQTLTAAGTYTTAFDVGTDCDSVVTLVLSVGAVNVNVIQVGNTLTALSALGPYQWVDCNNGNAPVSGANNQNFTPAQNGSYAVIVTTGGCSDTSACYNVTSIGIEEEAAPIARIAPQPVHDQLTVTLANPLERMELSLTDVQGRLLQRLGAQRATTRTIDASALAPGVYVLQVRTAERSGSVRFVKE